MYFILEMSFHVIRSITENINISSIDMDHRHHSEGAYGIELDSSGICPLACYYIAG